MAKKEKNKKTKKRNKFLFALKILLLLFLITTLVATVVLYIKYGDRIIAARKDAHDLVEASSPDTFRAVETSLVFDDKGRQIAALKGDKDIYYVTLDKIPQCVQDAVIVTEDRKFYSHKGVDYKAMGAAFFSLIKNRGHISRGGSTITQQLAKNMFLTNEQTMSRKVKEMFIARELEKKYSKDQILEYYLNNIYYANGYYGIEAASRGYFSKSCSDLTLGEAMFLCAIPNSPVRYNPLDNYDNAVERKNRILDQMLDGKKIDKAEYDDAYDSKIVLNVPKPVNRNFVETYALYCAVRALMESHSFEFKTSFSSEKEREQYLDDYNDEYSICQNSLYREGYRIYTSINTKKQKLLQSEINKQLKPIKDKNEEGVYKFQGAGVCIDNKSGKVVAIVGGRSQSSIEGRTLNRAFQSHRQPGSAIKPILVYAPAFENGYTPSSVMKDAPIKDGPKNSNGKYLGDITLRTAVWQSTNTVAWNLLNELKPKTCMPYLLNMGFSEITKDDYNLAAALGGLTNGVSPVEMASAYATLANSGIYNEATCVRKITDSDGNVIVSKKMFKKDIVYHVDAATAMTDVLKGVLTNGTGRGFALSRMPSAGKTGTTNDKKDGWFAGYTPYYTTVVWVGYDIPQSRDDLLGNTYPARIWHNFMEEIHAKLKPKDFPKYTDPNPVATPGETPSPTPEVTEEPEEDDDNEDDNIPEDDPGMIDPSDDIVPPPVVPEPQVPDPGNDDQTAPETPTESPEPTEPPASETDGSDTGDGNTDS